jgi:hypothetical protein
MAIQVLNIPIDSKEVNEFVDMFQLKSRAEKYRNTMLRHMKEQWGEDLGEEQDGYIDGNIEVVDDGQLVFPFKDLQNKNLDEYLSNKVGDFSLYARLWNSTPSEYEIEVPFNIGTTEDEYWVDLNLTLDGNLNVRSASVTYDTDEPGHKLLTYWALKQSN